MKVILKEEIEKLGHMGQIVNVKDGYARNFLIPRGMAAVANMQSERAMQHELQVIQKKAAKLKKAAAGLAERISGMAVTIKARAGEEDKLFGSVTSMDIAEALKSQGLEIDRKKIVADPIKRLGEYEVIVKLGQEVSAKVKVTVVPEEAAQTAAAKAAPEHTDTAS